MGDMLSGIMGGDSMGGFTGDSGDSGGVVMGPGQNVNGEIASPFSSDYMNYNGGNGGASSGDPGGELNAGGGAAKGGGFGGLLGTGIGSGNGLLGLGNILKAGAGGGKGNSGPDANTASNTQVSALRSIIGMVTSAFNDKQSSNRLQLKNSIVSEGGGDAGGEASI